MDLVEFSSSPIRCIIGFPTILEKHCSFQNIQAKQGKDQCSATFIALTVPTILSFYIPSILHLPEQPRRVLRSSLHMAVKM